MDGLPVVLVLAAGAAVRFGGPGHKLLQSLAGSTVIETTLRHVAATGLPFVVITRAALQEALGQAMRHVGGEGRLVVLDEEASARGIGHSIATAVSSSPQASGWLVLPGDMPVVRPSTIRRVAQSLQEHAVAYAQYRGRRGHPVGFGSELFSELVRLDGDEGARRLVARYPAQGVEVDDPGVLLDIDTPPDLEVIDGELSRRGVASASAALRPATGGAEEPSALGSREA